MKKILFGVTIPLTARIFLVPHLLRMAESGWEVHLATDPGEDESEMNSWKHHPEVNFHEISMKREPNLLRDISSLLSWFRVVRMIRPEVIVYSTPKASLLASVAARTLRVPTRIYHLRGLRLEGQSGFSRWVSVVCERIAMRISTEVVCDSPSLRKRVLELKLATAGKLLVLGHGSCSGVDTEHFRPATRAERAAARHSYSLPEETIVIGFVGRLSPDKGIRELVMAVEALHNRGLPVHLVVVGPRDLTATRLNRYLDTLDHTWLAIEGPLFDPLNAFWAFDIFCSPSHREGFPIAILEAQSCGIPVVTTRATGCIDAISDATTGLLVEADDVESLAMNLEFLLSNDTARMEMSIASRRRVLDDFNQDLVITRWHDFIQSAAQRT